MSEIKAIPTRYKGYHFRSRLEARWAVFFDTLGLEWEYEPEGFDLGGQAYLPDFFVEGYFAEVKPRREMSGFAICKRFSRLTGKSILCLGGTPDFIVYPYYVGGVDFTFCFVDTEAHDGEFFYVQPGSADVWEECDEVWFPDYAIYAARSARFEYGQCGAT